jgi:hypothetical protein
LKNSIGILNSGQYLHQNGKPVVAIWGFGFTGNAVSVSTSLQVINWFKSQGVYPIKPGRGEIRRKRKRRERKDQNGKPGVAIWSFGFNDNSVRYKLYKHAFFILYCIFWFIFYFIIAKICDWRSAL